MAWITKKKKKKSTDKSEKQKEKFNRNNGLLVFCLMETNTVQWSHCYALKRLSRGSLIMSRVTQETCVLLFYFYFAISQRMKIEAFTSNPNVTQHTQTLFLHSHVPPIRRSGYITWQGYNIKFLFYNTYYFIYRNCPQQYFYRYSSMKKYFT